MATTGYWIYPVSLFVGGARFSRRYSRLSSHSRAGAGSRPSSGQACHHGPGCSRRSFGDGRRWSTWVVDLGAVAASAVSGTLDLLDLKGLAGERCGVSPPCKPTAELPTLTPNRAPNPLLNRTPNLNPYLVLVFACKRKAHGF